MGSRPSATPAGRAARRGAGKGRDPAVRGGVRPGPGGGFPPAVATRRRPLMIAAGVLLFGAGSLHVIVNGHLLPLPRLKDSVRTESPRSASETTPSAAADARAAAAPAPTESPAAPTPQPGRPRRGPPRPRRPRTATGEARLL